MPQKSSLRDSTSYTHVTITDHTTARNAGNSILVGEWFVFFKADWLRRTNMNAILVSAGLAEVTAKPAIAFRGKGALSLPGATIQPTPLPRPHLISLTCDKALYRANRDTVRLLIAAPQHPNTDFKLTLRLSGNAYAEYTVTLDEYGLYLWSMQGLPEGEYEAELKQATGDLTSEICRFEVAEYRLAALNAELIAQTFSGTNLTYTLSVTTFGQPYTGTLEVELQERGKRVGSRTRLTGDGAGHYQGTCTLSGTGPYTLNIFAGERTATVALKGSEQERRETLTISELGEIQELSLLPLPDGSECRGMYIGGGKTNTAPLLVRRLIGNDVEITPRSTVELLNVVIVDPTRGTHTETIYEQQQAGQPIRLPIPTPYGVVLLGAFINGMAWEGWCSVFHPSELQLSCEAPREAKPGSRVIVILKTGITDRIVPIQLIVKDQRLIAPSDPQVEFAACIKKNLTTWSKQAFTGEVVFPLSDYESFSTRLYYPSAAPFGAPGWSGGPLTAGAALPVPPPPPMLMAMPAPPPPGSSGDVFRAPQAPMQTSAPMLRRASSPRPNASKREKAAVQTEAAPTTLTRVRMQFPEIIYNNIVKVQGEAQVEIKLGDSMTQYSIEAFALSPTTLDWQRAETTLEARQPVYGELTVSPFVMPGDPVMGRLDVGAASGHALVEIRLDDTLLPLFDEAGHPLPANQPVASGSVVRFPVRPGTLTAIVRDAQTGEADVSERYITEPGKLRHISHRLRLLTPGDEVTLREQPHILAIKPMPGLERPFQFFVEGASKYPFG